MSNDHTYINILETNNHVIQIFWEKNCFSHQDNTKVLNLAALIPSSTAEVERVFFIMKLESTSLQKRLLSKKQQLFHVYLQVSENPNFILSLNTSYHRVCSEKEPKHIAEKSYVISKLV